MNEMAFISFFLLRYYSTRSIIDTENNRSRIQFLRFIQQHVQGRNFLDTGKTSVKSQVVVEYQLIILQVDFGAERSEIVPEGLS